MSSNRDIFPPLDEEFLRRLESRIPPENLAPTSREIRCWIEMDGIAQPQSKSILPPEALSETRQFGPDAALATALVISALASFTIWVAGWSIVSMCFAFITAGNVYLGLRAAQTRFKKDK